MIRMAAPCGPGGSLPPPAAVHVRIREEAGAFWMGASAAWGGAVLSVPHDFRHAAGGKAVMGVPQQRRSMQTGACLSAGAG